MREVGRIASGYVYYVSLKGVTGAGHLDTGAVAADAAAHPRACEGAGGRGLRHPRRRHGAGAWPRCADAVVIGSRLVQMLEAQPRDSVGRRARREASSREIRTALDCASTPTDKEEHRMSWLEKLLPPKIQPTDPSERRTVPEGLWIKCPSCETVLYKTDLEQNLNVCPKCGHHHRIGARARLDAFLDAEGRYEIGQEVLPVDALKFKDSTQVPRAPEGGPGGHRRDRRAGGDGRRGA